MFVINILILLHVGQWILHIVNGIFNQELSQLVHASDDQVEVGVSGPEILLRIQFLYCKLPTTPPGSKPIIDSEQRWLSSLSFSA